MCQRRTSSILLPILASIGILILAVTALKYLPQEYGGENGSLNEVSAENNKLWYEFREYFERTKDYGTDESLRRGDPIDFDGLFGMGGTFRKLNVD